jgi:hypothetical protein
MKLKFILGIQFAVEFDEFLYLPIFAIVKFEAEFKI